MRLTLCALGFVALGFSCGGKSLRIGADPLDDDGQGATPGGGASGTGDRGGVSGSVGPSGGTVAALGGTGATLSRGGGNTAGSAPLEPPGPTYCGGVQCAAPRACCLATGTCFDPMREPQLCPRPEPKPDDSWAPCASNAHCGSGETCMLEPGSLCQGNGECVPLASCPGSGYSICGCDGNSYPNVETACRSGTTAGFFFSGSCGETIDANSGESPPRPVTLCGHDAHCSNGERCCTLTGACYPVSDPGRCQVPPEGTRNPCTADDQCFPGYEFCAGPGCSGPGGCANIEKYAEECGVRLEPVCGCNGVTYTSATCAGAEGVRVAGEGACPE